VWKTFEMEEYGVETTNTVSREVVTELSLNLDFVLRDGEGRTADPAQLERIYAVADATAGGKRVISVDRPKRNNLIGSYRQLSFVEACSLEPAGKMWRELGF